MVLIPTIWVFRSIRPVVLSGQMRNRALCLAAGGLLSPVTTSTFLVAAEGAVNGAPGFIMWHVGPERCIE